MTNEKNDINRILSDMQESVKQTKEFINDYSYEGLKSLVNHMLNNYVARKMVDACYNGSLRNEFVEKVAGILNGLYGKNVFDSKYEVLYKKSGDRSR